MRDPQPGRPLPPIGPLVGATVLVPRSPDRAAGLAELLRGAGAHVLVSPVIDRAPIEDTTTFDRAVLQLTEGGFAWVVVTSVNAIEEIAESADRLGVDLAHVGAQRVTRWAAVGPATRRALQALGIQIDLEPTENSARGLLGAFDQLPGLAPAREEEGANEGNRVFVPQGDLARPTMADGLTDRGYAPHVVTAYRTISHDITPEVVDAWTSGSIDVVVLTSGSVAREVARQLGPRPDVAGVAIGAPTATAARDVGIRIDAVAERATDDALAAAVKAAVAAATPAQPATASDTPQETP